MKLHTSIHMDFAVWKYRLCNKIAVIKEIDQLC